MPTPTPRCLGPRVHRVHAPTVGRSARARSRDRSGRAPRGHGFLCVSRYACIERARSGRLAWPGLTRPDGGVAAAARARASGARATAQSRVSSAVRGATAAAGLTLLFCVLLLLLQL